MNKKTKLILSVAACAAMLALTAEARRGEGTAD